MDIMSNPNYKVVIKICAIVQPILLDINIGYQRDQD